jgi:2-polyprenyl-6-methoxyphenol hydroxylase-like FAD-dependent oxidoreductase
MRRHFPAEHYHQGAELTDFEQSAERVEARFADGREVTGGLMIAADGGGSFVRRRLMPEVRADYAGYVAWRGLVDGRPGRGRPRDFLECAAGRR